MATQEQFDAILDEVITAIEAIVLEDLKVGADDTARVRVWPDGSVVATRDTSDFVFQSEYYDVPPRPLILWEAAGIRPAATPLDGVFGWEAKTGGPYIGDIEGPYRMYKICNDLDGRELTDLRARGWQRFTLDRESIVCDDILGDRQALRAEMEEKLVAWAEENLTASIEA
jgi:hypothetical protein